METCSCVAELDSHGDPQSSTVFQLLEVDKSVVRDCHYSLSRPSCPNLCLTRTLLLLRLATGHGRRGPLDRDMLWQREMEIQSLRYCISSLAESIRRLILCRSKYCRQKALKPHSEQLILHRLRNTKVPFCSLL